MHWNHDAKSWVSDRLKQCTKIFKYDCDQFEQSTINKFGWLHFEFNSIRHRHSKTWLYQSTIIAPLNWKKPKIHSFIPIWLSPSWAKHDKSIWIAAIWVWSNSTQTERNLTQSNDNTCPPQVENTKNTLHAICQTQMISTKKKACPKIKPRLNALPKLGTPNQFETLNCDFEHTQLTSHEFEPKQMWLRGADATQKYQQLRCISTQTPHQTTHWMLRIHDQQETRTMPFESNPNTAFWIKSQPTITRQTSLHTGNRNTYPPAKILIFSPRNIRDTGLRHTL